MNYISNEGDLLIEQFLQDSCSCLSFNMLSSQISGTSFIQAFDYKKVYHTTGIV